MTKPVTEESLFGELNSLESRISDLELNSVSTRMTPEQLSTMNAGAGEVLSNNQGTDSPQFNASYALQKNTTTGELLTVVFTPQVNCWWRVHGSVAMKVVSGDWSRVDVRVSLADGVKDSLGKGEGPTAIFPSHPSLGYNSVQVQGLFKLSAGVTYNAVVSMVANSGTWVYYVHSTYNRISCNVQGFW